MGLPPSSRDVTETQDTDLVVNCLSGIMKGNIITYLCVVVVANVASIRHLLARNIKPADGIPVMGCSQ